MLSDSKSFHIDIGRFQVQDNYLYGRDGSSSNIDMDEDGSKKIPIDF